MWESSRSAGSTVHPHTRGERRGRNPHLDGQVGSSPHPWGTPRKVPPAVVNDRFIPTPVGNASKMGDFPRGKAVHPHTRGERCFSPGVPGASNRFIPTPVGNAATPKKEPKSWAVHPHTRGERFDVRQRGFPIAGSSPHPWGTQRRPPASRGRRRFIPTPVGNANSVDAIVCDPPVHPHTRGERTFAARTFTARTGSSPHPWGTLAYIIDHVGNTRFIPTPVGNASRTPRRQTWPAVHPHTRGERGQAQGLRGTFGGSSPHPWGTHS